MSDQGDGSVKNLGVFSTLQSATELKFFLLAMTFVLLVDAVLVGTGQPGLLDLVASKDLLERSNIAAKAVLIIVCFSFLASLVMRVFLYRIFFELTHELLFTPVYHLKNFLNPKRYEYRREHDHVTLSELRKEAHETQEKYYLDLLKEHETERRNDLISHRQHILYSLYCLLMYCADCRVGWHAQNSFAFTLLAHQVDPMLCAIGGFLALLCTFLYFVFEDVSWPSIYCPVLYRKVMDAKREAEAALLPPGELPPRYAYQRR